MSDALSEFVPRDNGVFMKISETQPAVLRVLTLDPMVSSDKWGNTKFSFIVWDWADNKPKILSRGASILKGIRAIHLDEEFPAINKVDIKIVAEGEGKETRYTIMALPKAREFTSTMLNEAKLLKLETVIKNGIRLSQMNAGEEVPLNEEGEDSGIEDFDMDNEPSTTPGYDKARETAEHLKENREIKKAVDEVFPVDGDEKVDLNDAMPADFLL